ncbi:MAG: ABC transporter ATP-binding protein [Litorilinea sp.]
MAQVSLVNLYKDYGETAAVIDLNLAVARGELVALLGPSGCGKTSTLRMIAGLLPPSRGDIQFDGRSVLAIPAERRGAVMVFQKHLLFPHMTVGENVAFGLKMRGESGATLRRKVGDMLGMVQLAGFENRRSHELSGGQQQRVALARALVIEPAVLLLDEPLANLDANLRLEMRRLIRTLQQALEMTTLFVTHDQEEAIMLADQVAVMDGGRLLQQGTPRALYEQPASPTVARFFRNENLLAGVKQGLCVETGGYRLAVDPARAALCADGPVWITARPEQVQVLSGAQIPVAAAANTLPAQQVGDVVYRGGYSQIQFQLCGQLWTGHLSTDAARDFPAGGSVETGIPAEPPLGIHLPPQHIWLMPRSI